MTPPFRKILVANRGEIALRVFRTCAEYGIRTVAVYSDADRDALHAQQADEAVHIGPAASAESYLRADKILAAAKATGAEAIHPGYGFLSERAHFVEACKQAGVVFIGPDVRAMEVMGDKIGARKAMAAAGVPVVPGVNDIESMAAVEAAAKAGSGWAKRSAFNRGQILYRLAEMMEARGVELAESITLSGVSKAEASREVAAAMVEPEPRSSTSHCARVLAEVPADEERRCRGQRGQEVVARRLQLHRPVGDLDERHLLWHRHKRTDGVPVRAGRGGVAFRQRLDDRRVAFGQRSAGA